MKMITMMVCRDITKETTMTELYPLEWYGEILIVEVDWSTNYETSGRYGDFEHESGVDITDVRCDGLESEDLVEMYEYLTKGGCRDFVAFLEEQNCEVF